MYRVRGGDAARVVRGCVRWRRGGGAELVRGGVRYRRGGFPRGRDATGLRTGATGDRTGESQAANNYSASLIDLRRFEEVKALLNKTLPVARRVLGENHDQTLRLRATYAQSLYKDPTATLDDLREAVTTLEDMERTARRVFGGAHPFTKNIEGMLRNSRAKLRAREGA